MSASSSEVDLAEQNFFEQYSTHYLVLDASGKPVFSSRDDAGSSSLALFALLRAVYSKLDEEIEEIEGSNGLQIIFAKKSELLFVSLVHDGSEQSDQGGKSKMDLQRVIARDVLDLLYKHMLFHITRPGLEKFVKQNLDLGMLLGGTDSETKAMLDSVSTDLCIALDSVQSFVVSWDLRKPVIEALNEARRLDLAPFAYLVAKDGSIVAGLGPPSKRNKYGNAFASRTDCTLLSNFVRSARAASSGIETWTPICLPEFDDSGYFHAYCALASESVFIVLFTTDASLDIFHESSKRRKEFQEKCKSELQAIDNIFLKNKHELDLDEIFSGEPENSALSSSLLHVAMRIVFPVSGARQHTETKLNGKWTTYSPTTVPREYIVSRYASLRRLARNDVKATPEDGSMLDSSTLSISSSFLLSSSVDSENATRTIFDSSLRDVAVYSKEGDCEYYCIFRPFSSAETCAAVLTKLKAASSKMHRQTLFCAATISTR